MLFLLFRLTKAALPQFVVVNGFIFATTTKDVWSIQKVVTKSISRNVVDLMISLTFLFFLCLYIYICICEEKRLKNETSSLFLREWFKTEATTVVWRHKRARMCRSNEANVTRNLTTCCNGKDLVLWVFRVLSNLKKKRRDGPERKVGTGIKSLFVSNDAKFS